MSIENMKKLRNAVKAHGPEHFGMEYWFTDRWCRRGLLRVDEVDISDCGTTACLAGHAAILMRQEGLSFCTISDVSEWLGVHQDLFFKCWWSSFGSAGSMAYEITREGDEWRGALYLLDELIKEGEANERAANA